MTHQIDSLADRLEDTLWHLDQRDSVRVTGIICDYKSVLSVIGGDVLVSRAPEDLDGVEQCVTQVESELRELQGIEMASKTSFKLEIDPVQEDIRAMTDTFTYDEPQANAAFGTLCMEKLGGEPHLLSSSTEPVQWDQWREDMERISEMFPTAIFVVIAEWDEPGDAFGFFKITLRNAEIVY